MKLRSLDTSYNECVLIASEEKEDIESRYLTKEVETEVRPFLNFKGLKYCCSRKLPSN